MSIPPEALVRLSCRSVKRHKDDVGYSLVVTAKRLCEAIDSSFEPCATELRVAANFVADEAERHFKSREKQ